MKFEIETIPHKEQRYPTVGDWQFVDYGRCLRVRVSKMTDKRYEFLVGIHELIEAFLANEAGVKESDVDKFDMEYEEARPEGDESEPGNHPKCPVYRQHRIATGIETLLAAELGVDWNAYEAEINRL